MSDDIMKRLEEEIKDAETDWKARAIAMHRRAQQAEGRLARTMASIKAGLRHEPAVFEGTILQRCFVYRQYIRDAKREAEKNGKEPIA